MRVRSLRDLFVEELQDLFDAEQQIVQALPDLAAATQHDELKHALIEHLDQTKMHVERLQLICREFDVKPDGEPWPAMRVSRLSVAPSSSSVCWSSRFDCQCPSCEAYDRAQP